MHINQFKFFFFSVAERCCPEDVRCCFQQYIMQKPLNVCMGLGDRWRSATVCTEKELKSNKSVQENRKLL